MRQTSLERRGTGYLLPALVGAAVFVACHGLLALSWERFFQPAVLETPWFLGSKTGIVFTQATMGVAGLVLAARAAGWRRRFTDAGLMTAGAMAAVAATFFLIGPDRLLVGAPDLWPVALVSALLLLAPAILAGALLGGYVRGLKK